MPSQKLVENILISKYPQKSSQAEEEHFQRTESSCTGQRAEAV